MIYLEQSRLLCDYQQNDMYDFEAWLYGGAMSYNNHYLRYLQS